MGHDMNHVTAPFYWGSALHVAVMNNHEALMRLLIEEGAEIGLLDSDEDTALHKAAEYGNLAAVEILQENGADADAKNRYGESALLVAHAFGEEAIVRHLAMRGANVRAESAAAGDTALHRAVEFSDDATVELLLDCGADVDCLNRKRETPLVLAARRGRLGVVRMLLERGADAGVLASDVETCDRNALDWVVEWEKELPEAVQFRGEPGGTSRLE
jgi:ankyrin repeat protein